MCKNEIINERYHGPEISTYYDSDDSIVKGCMNVTLNPSYQCYNDFFTEDHDLNST